MDLITETLSENQRKEMFYDPEIKVCPNDGCNGYAIKEK
jgi:hypothetical protein